VLSEHFVFCSQYIWQAKCNAWMETTIIHKFLFPPFSPLPANVFFLEIYYSHVLIYILQTCNKKPCLLLKELERSQRFNESSLLHWRGIASPRHS